ncbi:MAG: ribosome silencing factor [Lachnospiraceae bacterium]|nr:ribosome silencing factor [Lachnospiraceae bacterium]
MSETEKMMAAAVQALESKKAEDVKIINIAEISSIADCFVIASGTNRNQVQAMADAVEETLGKEKIHARSIEGYAAARWILMDYGDVVFHLFDRESRSFYDLERIWRDGKNIDPKFLQDF